MRTIAEMFPNLAYPADPVEILDRPPPLRPPASPGGPRGFEPPPPRPPTIRRPHGQKLAA